MSTKPSRKKPAAGRGGRARNKPLSQTPIIVFLLVVCGLATLCIGTGLAWFLSLDIPDIRSAGDYRPLVATRVLDRHGREIDAIFREYRIVIPYRRMAPLLPRAFVAAEDSRYWHHGGLDIWSIVRAAVNNLRSGRRSQGGSTITQQVTRSLLLTREKSYFRKITEAILAYRLDRMLSKKEILAIYLNEIYLGEGAYGVEAAARTYFGKSAADLDLAEIALLAGLPQAPSRYSPLTHFEAARARQRYVLNRMAEDGIITPAQARRAWAEKIRLRKSGRHKERTGYFTGYVRRQLSGRYGSEELYRQGLVVSTTLDSGLQEAAVRAVRNGADRVRRRQKAQHPPQGALVALDDTGRILAMVGGLDYGASPYNRAVVARRQPGSVFKPLIYAAAFERGMSPDSVIDDQPLAIRNRDGSTWKPKNYDNRFHGPTSLREALVHSRNIVTIRLLQEIGIRPVLDLAKKAGITAPLKPELPLALGASPVSLLEMTGAYTIFSGDGLLHAPFAITRVRDRDGRVHPWSRQAARRVISPATARLMASILAEVIGRGTGRPARGIPGAAGKTGTSDDNRDAWFIGFTRSVTAGVWLGYDRGRSLGRGETGGRAAAPVWKEFMQSTLHR